MADLIKQGRNLIIQVIDWFYQPFKNYLPIETFRYAATGGFNMTCDIFLYYIFYNFIFNKQIIDLGFVSISPHIAAFIFVFPITFTNGFLLAKYITFTESKIRGHIQLFRYILSVGGSITLNYLLLKLFVEVFELYAITSKITTTLIVIVYSYLVQRYFTFKTAK